MNIFIKSILNLASSIELSSDDDINPDFAVKLLEQLSYDLKNLSKGDLELLKATIRQEIVELGEDRSHEDQERVTFLLNFIEDLNLKQY
jgi:hypothetical protein